MAIACVVVALTFGGAASRAYGQTVSGSIRGAVSDATGGVLVDAVASLTNRETAWTQTTRTASDGSFQFLALAPGNYRLQLRADGFAAVTFDIDVTVRREVTLPIVMPLADQSQTIEVSGAVPLIDRSDTSLSRTFTRDELDALPILTPRESDALIALVPGIFPATNGQSAGVSAAAQGLNSNTQLVDGLSRDNVTGSLPLEAAREFRVMANQFSAEFGQASGAVVSIVTRSGGNDASGRIYDFQQHSAMNATAPAAKRAGADEPGATQASFGGWWGGPLVPSRAFMFASAEQLHRDTNYVNTSPVVQQFRPDQPVTVPVTWRLPKFFARADTQLATHNTFTLRLSYQRAEITNAAREPLSAAERGRHLDDPWQNLAAADTHLFSGSSVNEARAQWGRERFDRDVSCDGCATLNYLNILLGKPAGDPQVSINDRFEFADSVTWLRTGHGQSHRVKLGVDVNVATLHGAQQTNTVGTYTFSHDLAFDASDRTTYPSRFTQNTGDPRVSARETIVSAFAQDEWRHDALSLNLGVRWDHTRWPGPSGARNDVAPRFGAAFDPWKRGRTVLRASAGRYYDERQLGIARDAAVGFVTVTIRNPGYQGDPRQFDPYGPNPNRLGPAVPVYSFNGFVPTSTPYTDQVSVGVQALRRDIKITVDVVNAVGHRLPVGRDLNYPDAATHQRPNQAISQIIATETTAHSWYSGLQVGVQKQLAHGYSYAFAYTLSTAENDTDGARNFPQDQNLDLGVERGPAPFDSRHRFTATGTTALPFGLQLSTVMTARSALPYNITTGSDDNADGVTNDRPAGEPRNAARGSTFFQADTRLSRVFRPGRQRVELLVEAFNVTNRANWLEYSGKKPGSAGFALPTTSGPARQIQLGVRVDF